jgi:hypothetical protein
MIGRVTLSICTALLVALVTSLSAGAQYRGDPGGIAFDFWEGQSMEIGVLRTDGTRVNLTRTTGTSEHAPRWSPDGRRIVFHARPFSFADQNRPPDIWVMDADGSNRTRITETPLGEFVPAWTADGRIVFCGQSGDAGGVDIYMVGADGTGLVRLTNAPGLDCWPAPAPSGNRLSFTSERDGNTQIFTMKPDGSNIRQVTSGQFYNWASDWSPSGNSLTFIRESLTDVEDTDVWTIRSDGTGERQLTFDGPGRPEAFPSWSPDGTKIVFGGIVESGVYNVFSIDLATGAEQTVVDDDPPNSWSVAYPAWQPVGPSTNIGRPNLALGRSVTASNAYSGYPPSDAVDGNWFTYWSAGGFPPQWIEVDLGSVQRVDEINLGVTQLPDCSTVHRVFGRAATSEPYVLLREFSGFTVDQQNLRYVASSPRQLRYVRVETAPGSCSWVGWREITVHGP